ncbi:protein-glutamate methylesterase/protein-glutamine glutaminase [Euzebya rosea]|uniref:protein-glutamate methylesterase/protein-glutamine glutaminase n=1 Tax=Euzebya rosea TaxID=2052804 RepID=UPI00196B40FA|nr:chemotaxis response regulator protein-glutamate methylesterase [Euzebya rosea]
MTTAPDPYRVLLVDDSSLIRRLLHKIIQLDPGVVVAGEAANGREALTAVEREAPDLVVLDIEMPVMDGLETLEHLKRRHPDLPVIMFSTLTARGATATLDALTKGADDYVTKPSNTGSFAQTAEQVMAELTPRIKALVDRRRARRTPPTAAVAAPPSRVTTMRPPSPAVPVTAAAAGASSPSPMASGRSRPTPRMFFRPQVVVVAVSTGGPDALQTLVPLLSPTLHVPVLVTQHMPPLFTRLLAERLDGQSGIRVREGYDGARPGPGEVWLAPGGSHMLLRAADDGRVVLALDDGPPVQSCKPAADPMFASAVDIFDRRVIGVVLTGMGIDGLDGARRVQQAGGMVICQDEASSVVWGMPGAVHRAGLAEQVLPLRDIATTIGRVTDTSEPRPLTVGARPAGVSR